MKLVPIYFPFPNDFGYVKAIVYDTDLEFFEPLGTFYRSSKDIPTPVDAGAEPVNIVVEVGGRELSLPEDIAEGVVEPVLVVVQPEAVDGLGELLDVSPEAVLSTPDEGFGQPGSLQFHTHFIMSFATVEEVKEYMEALSNSPFDTAGSLTVVKNRAIKQLKGLLTDG